MKSIRLQIAIIIGLWVIAEAWLAFYWWPTEYFPEAPLSVGIPVTAIAMVMIAWICLRPYVIKLARESSQGKLCGIALLLAASISGGFAPYSLGRILADIDMLRPSFHGEAGWPSAICSISLWFFGTIYFAAALVEIIAKTNTEQGHVHN